jgi:hypothetical protein
LDGEGSPTPICSVSPAATLKDLEYLPPKSTSGGVDSAAEAIPRRSETKTAVRYMVKEANGIVSIIG